MSKKINYISHLNGFMQRRVYDLLGPAATTLYLVIFDAFNKSCWNFEWLRLPTKDLMYRTGLSSTHTLASNRKFLMDLGYIKFRLVKHGGKVYSAYKLTPLDNNGMFLDNVTENFAGFDESPAADVNDDPVDNVVDNVVDNITLRCSTATHSATQTATESATQTATQSATESATHPATLYIDKKEKEEKKEVKEKEEDVRKPAEQKSASREPEATIADGQLQVLCDAYADYTQKPVSIKDRQKISCYLSRYGFNAMLEAMDIMIKKKATSIDYCGGILKNMQKDIDKQAQEAVADGWQLA